MQIWEVARQLLVAPRKAALAAAAEEEGRARVLEGQRVRRAEEVVDLQNQEEEWAKEWERRLVRDAGPWRGVSSGGGELAALADATYVLLLCCHNFCEALHERYSRGLSSASSLVKVFDEVNYRRYNMWDHGAWPPNVP